ncbi:MAG TPA: hypothetical protein VFD73_26530 [Gemmatimonadales bacterium]|nr:hypothetical protein [Gemmatimonadales bacterium]
MRKYLGLSVISVCLLVLLTGTTAFAGTSSTYYAGKNTQGQKLLFSVDQTANGPRFDPFFYHHSHQLPGNWQPDHH